MMVLYFYIGFIVFTIVYQLTLYLVCNKKKSVNADQSGNSIVEGRVNNTVSTSGLDNSNATMRDSGYNMSYGK